MPYLPTLDVTSLVILEQDEVRCYSLETQNQWTIGRASPGNTPDIPLISAIAGRKHGELIYVDSEWFYIDNGSLNGTFHNGNKVESGLNGRTEPVLLQNGDILRIDYSDFNTPDRRGVWMLFTTSNVEGKWIHIPLMDRNVLKIGRDPQICNIVLPFPYISASHTKITYLNGAYYVSDCNSRAGTWLNGKEVTNPLILKEKDQISICDCNFIFTGRGLIYNDKSPKSTHQQINNTILSVDIRSKKVHDQNGFGQKELLHNIHLNIHSGQLIALLGSSGAGKSTLMNCLNGTDKCGFDGTVLFQEENLYQNYKRLKYLIGNVPQRNIVHEMLSVEAELKNAAILRLPGDTTREEINRQVESTLKSLNLSTIRNTQIKKLSGGEKKRVNIGVELVADRKFLCLDEPDAGLDPQYKEELFLILQRLVHKKGKTILAIIHDVSSIDLFDQIILMVKVNGVGRLAFAGTPNQARQYFDVKDLREVYSLVEKEPERYLMA